MKDEKEINVSVAKVLGWTNILGNTGHKPGEVSKTSITPAIDRIGYVPNYSTDANTRPEMLASLTRAEKERVIQMALSPLAESFGIQVFDIIRILELDQPTFARLFCKVKGLL